MLPAINSLVTFSFSKNLAHKSACIAVENLMPTCMIVLKFFVIILKFSIKDSQLNLTYESSPAIKFINSCSLSDRGKALLDKFLFFSSSMIASARSA